MKTEEERRDKINVLVVDDDRFNLKVASSILQERFSVRTANSGKQALERMEELEPTLILLDIYMPEMDGRQTMEKIRENEEWRKIPVIFLTADANPETEKECLTLGASDFIVKPFVPMVMLSRVSRTIELYELQNDLEARLAEKTKLVEQVSLNSIMAIANTIDAKDAYTSGHSIRVAQCSEAIAEKLGWDPEEIRNIHYIALLHDIGKIGIPDAILNKPTKLSGEEFSVIKKHPVIGNEILKDIYMIKNVAEGALYHHERYDGKGYPAGISGEDIPVCARIIGIADSYDAMTSNRIYRPRLSDERVIEEFEKGKGTQFDPELADLFIDMMKSGFHLPDSKEEMADVQDDSSALLNKILTEYTVGVQSQAVVDSLTGLHSRSYGEGQIAKLLAKGHKGAFFMIDMDNFKHINDSFGHIAGDNTLKLFAKTLLDSIGKRDVACRFGGDEFIVFFTDETDRSHIARKAGEILSTLKERLTELDYGNVTSVSIGIAIAPVDGKSFDMLYSNADKSLYYAKKNGKNQYAFFSEEQSENSVGSTGTDLAHIRYMIEGRMDMNNGIFEVEYNDFKHLYNYISRGIRRNAQSVQVLLFTISTENKKWDNANYEEAMKALEIAVASSLRMVDIGTKYSSMQYIVILMDTDLANGRIAAERVVKEFYKICANTNVTLAYDIQTVAPGELASPDSEGR